MKKIAIILDDMGIGGIPKACITFANQLVQYCDVTMIMSRDDGALMNMLPPAVHIRLLSRDVLKKLAPRLLKQCRFFHFLNYAVPYCLARRGNRWVKTNELTAKENGILIPEEFDCAIAYHGMNIGHLVTTLYNVSAKKKIAWIHGDHPFNGIHGQDILKIYQKFDRIYCCSPVMRERFLKDFPALEDITDSYKNILEPEVIRKKAQEECIGFDGNYVNIVTVGRVSPEKGQDLIPPITRKLLDAGLKIRWYAVGDGGDMERIQSLCMQYHVTDNVIFTGSKSNPYPYMGQCDIYVQPSYSEGYCLTVCEAAILQKPIVLTAAAAAAGILSHQKNALVVNPDADELAHGIVAVIADKNMQNRFIAALANEDFSNRDEIGKLLDFLEQ